jgi:hypothetical protein
MKGCSYVWHREFGASEVLRCFIAGELTWGIASATDVFSLRGLSRRHCRAAMHCVCRFWMFTPDMEAGHGSGKPLACWHAVLSARVARPAVA